MHDPCIVKMSNLRIGQCGSRLFSTMHPTTSQPEPFGGPLYWGSIPESSRLEDRHLNHRLEGKTRLGPIESHRKRSSRTDPLQQRTQCHQRHMQPIDSRENRIWRTKSELRTCRDFPRLLWLGSVFLRTTDLSISVGFWLLLAGRPHLMERIRVWNTSDETPIGRFCILWSRKISI